MHPSTSTRDASGAARDATATRPPWRIGEADAGGGEATLQWRFRRNCSLAPRQLLAVYLLLCAVSLGIAGMFWAHGAPLVVPFASVELLCLGIALLAYARHATDGESIRLAEGRLTVEQRVGSRTVRLEFVPAWVRVEPGGADRSLVGLSGQGQRVAIGRFVRPELRAQLADELKWALRRG